MSQGKVFNCTGRPRRTGPAQDSWKWKKAAGNENGTPGSADMHVKALCVDGSGAVRFGRRTEHGRKNRFQPSGFGSVQALLDPIHERHTGSGL